MFYIKVKNNSLLFPAIRVLQFGKQYFHNIDVKNLTDKKKFWKTIRLKFSNKCKTANTIILVENQKILQDEIAIATILLM